MYHPNLFGLIISQMPFLETHSYMLSSDACIFRLSPSCNCFVAWDKWPDQLHATASLLQSGESNPYLLHECQGYHTIAKLNSLLACSEKFVSKFHEIWFKCTRVSIEIQLISTILIWKIRTFRIINITLFRFGTHYMLRSESKFLVLL